jgi:hypothetical protein
MSNVFVDDWWNIISIEYGSKWFNITCSLTQKCDLWKKFWWIDIFVMDDIMVKKVQGKQQVEWTLRETLLNFWILVFASILFVMQFCMI